MSKFKVMLRGEHFPVHKKGRWQLLGFYSTRSVEADTFGDAEFNAVRQIQRDPTWKHVKPRHGFPTPRIFVEDIERVDYPEDFNDDYIFFTMQK